MPRAQVIRKGFLFSMQGESKIWKYLLFAILLLITVAVFAFIYALSDTAFAPSESVDTPNRVPDSVEITVNPNPVIFYEPEDEQGDEPGDDPVEAEDEPEDEQEEYTDLGYITVGMNEEDISRGYLLLVNYEHDYEIPENLGLVIITQSEAKTAPFRVLGNNYHLKESIIEPLDQMMTDYLSEKKYNTVAIISGWRSYNAQQKALDDAIALFGQSEAHRRVALPGHSEHHTGLAFDFGIYSGGARSTFTGVGITAWFSQNSYRYGFILRYPEDKTRITRTVHEPWHFRYVGLPHSYIMLQNNLSLEEYIELLGEHTFEEPFVAEYDGVEYRIYFTDDLEVRIPFDTVFDISGNNIDGFIVTVHTPSKQEALLLDCCGVSE